MATTAVIYYCKSHREDVTVAENPRTHLDFNLSRRSFGYLQVLHQLDVSQEVSGRGGEPWEQVVLQSFQSDFEAVLLLCEVRLQSKRHRKMCVEGRAKIGENKSQRAKSWTWESIWTAAEINVCRRNEASLCAD